jgi:hypothetical protein
MRLRGEVGMISLNEDLLFADVDAFLATAASALADEAMVIATEIAGHASTTLRALDEDAGHDALAPLWTFDVELTPDGARAEVFSAAEEITFFNRTGAQRSKSSLYPILGTRLLAILEGGAAAHPIEAGTVNPAAKALSIPIPGRRRTPGGDAWYPRMVNHPGAKAEHHVEMTFEQMMNWAESVAEMGADRIAARF